jgi:hypothetical protein
MNPLRKVYNLIPPLNYILTSIFLFSSGLFSQVQDNFENISQWQTVNSEQVEVSISSTAGVEDNSIKVSYEN